MKKSKIIVPALGVLVLSTAASISGTVAWFTANRTVTVEGMQVSAKASSDLYIANGSFNEGAWGSAPSLDTIANGKAIDVQNVATNGATELIPSSTSDYATWFYLANSSEIATGGGVYTGNPSAGKVSSITYAEATPAGIKDYVLVSRCYLALKAPGNAADVGDLSVTATIAAVDNAKDDMLNVLRCAVIVTGTGSTTALFSADGDDNTKPLTSATQVAASGVSVTASGTEADVYADFLSNTVYTVTAYVWFEGQDSECVNASTVLSADYTVDLSFTLA